ncbi:MAG: hypothetical protein LBL90_06580 [Prevotellaceae bacterium]|jgi:hypothetical protein|nr:hypothetical protein [Prevotellaceae bacterium]
MKKLIITLSVLLSSLFVAQANMPGEGQYYEPGDMGTEAFITVAYGQFVGAVPQANGGMLVGCFRDTSKICFIIISKTPILLQSGSTLNPDAENPITIVFPDGESITSTTGEINIEIQ